MITHSDDGPEFEPDDPLADVLVPISGYLGPPSGRYEAIRRGAARRWVLRTAAAAGMVCAVAAVVALPLRMTGPGTPASPAVPPAAGGPSAATPTRAPGPRPARPVPTGRTRTVAPGPSAVPTPTRYATAPTSQSVRPTAVRGGARSTPSPDRRR